MKPTVRDLLAAPFLFLATFVFMVGLAVVTIAVAIGGPWTAQQALILIRSKR